MLRDVIKSLNLQHSVEITSEAIFGGKHSDMWVLKTREGIPFLPIECKKPLTANQRAKRTQQRQQQSHESDIEDEDKDEVEEEEVKDQEVSLMDDPKVLGKCYHYMQQLRSSFGQLEVYGIITNLEHWRILRLPEHSPLTSTSSSTSNLISHQVTASKIYSLHHQGILNYFSMPLQTQFFNHFPLNIFLSLLYL